VAVVEVVVVVVVVVLGESEKPAALQVPMTHINNILESDSYLTENTDPLLNTKQTVNAV